MSDQDQVTSNKSSPPSTTPRALAASLNKTPSPLTTGTGTGSTTSRPVTPSSARGLTNPSSFSSTSAIGPQHVRRPSSSSLTSSRRTSLLTPPFAMDSSPSGDPLSLPQRLPRQPSSDFAELHNELEFEQEATVNRLLNMIRLQQIRNQQLLASCDDDKASSTGATFDSVNSTRARSPGPLSTGGGGGGGGGSGASGGRRVGISRQPSFTHSQGRPVSRASSAHTSSPMLQPLGAGTEETTGGFLLGGSRDEASFYMAETQMLTRENEMLKRRIKELERQVTELNKGVGVEDNPLVDARSAGEDKESTVTGVSAK